MRLGIMQPYFFPYAGHFALIGNVDKWVVFDITQYTPKSWISRNRVLHQTAGTTWVNVPLSNSSISIKIHEAQILDKSATEQSVLGKLSHYRRRAPFYSKVVEIVRATFAATGERQSLVELNVAGLDTVCSYLGLQWNRCICSELSLTLPADLGPGDWAPTISKLVGATCYINPYGGRALFDRRKFEQQGVNLKFLKTDDFVYSIKELDFIPNLSILDALMWSSPEVICEALETIATIVGPDDDAAS